MRAKRKSGRNKKSGAQPPEHLKAGKSGKAARVGTKFVSADWLSFLAIVGLAAGVRIAYAVASRQSPFFSHLDLDSLFYDKWARQIAAGDWIGTKVFFMGPLYPYFLAVVYKIAGPGLLKVKIIQGVLGALTAGLTFLLAREIFGKVAGLVAGFIAALYVPFIFYDTSILFPVLATLLNTSMLYFLYRGVLRG